MSIVEDYYDLCEQLAELAHLELEDYKDNDRSGAVRRALNNGFKYSNDRMVVLAHAFYAGAISWGSNVHWDSIYNDLAEDVENALNEMLKD